MKWEVILSTINSILNFLEKPFPFDWLFEGNNFTFIFCAAVFGLCIAMLCSKKLRDMFF